MRKMLLVAAAALGLGSNQAFAYMDDGSYSWIERNPIGVVQQAFIPVMQDPRYQWTLRSFRLGTYESPHNHLSRYICGDVDIYDIPHNNLIHSRYVLVISRINLKTLDFMIEAKRIRDPIRLKEMVDTEANYCGDEWTPAALAKIAQYEARIKKETEEGAANLKQAVCNSAPSFEGPGVEPAYCKH